MNVDGMMGRESVEARWVSVFDSRVLSSFDHPACNGTVGPLNPYASLPPPPRIHAQSLFHPKCREIAEAHLAVAVTDWAEGNSQSAKREAERALRALLEGKLGYIGKDEELLRRDAAQARSRRGGGPEAADEGVPVPLGLCVAAAGMLLAACRSR